MTVTAKRHGGTAGETRSNRCRAKRGRHVVDAQLFGSQRQPKCTTTPASPADRRQQTAADSRRQQRPKAAGMLIGPASETDDTISCCPREGRAPYQMIPPDDVREKGGEAEGESGL